VKNEAKMLLPGEERAAIGCSPAMPTDVSKLSGHQVHTSRRYASKSMMVRIVCCYYPQFQEGKFSCILTWWMTSVSRPHPHADTCLCGLHIPVVKARLFVVEYEPSGPIS